MAHLLNGLAVGHQCDPDEFNAANGWSLRTSNYGRQTDLLIAVTSYNEVILFNLTEYYYLLILSLAG
jgi:Chitin synthase N-terminal